MEGIVQISADFIEAHTDFSELVKAIEAGFSDGDVIVPQRHHHDFPNPETSEETTLLLMPAWHPGKNAGVKMVTISPENSRYGLPAVQGSYLLMDAVTGKMKAILEAKSLTTKRTAATSALASSYLSRKTASSLLMIGTGALSTQLIKAHASVRPISQVYVWGRTREKAQAVCTELEGENFKSTVVSVIEEIIGAVDIVSSATLSKTPLVLGKHLQPGQHIDLVGAYRKDMREADDEVIKRGSVFVDTYGGTQESGDLFEPLRTGLLREDEIKGDLFSLCSGKAEGRVGGNEITVFKSVGFALEDLVAASYYHNKFKNA